MSSALTVLVLGHAFFNTVPNTIPVPPDCTKAPSDILPPSLNEIPNIIQSLTETKTPTPKRQAIPPDYTYSPRIGAHKFFTEEVDWYTARKRCEEDGAYLVIINSVDEAEAVARLVESTYARASHVGVNDLNHEGEFVTIHGEALELTGFTKWNDEEPNNDWGDGTVENCVQLRFDVKLNDIPCTNYRSNFVCELS